MTSEDVNYLNVGIYTVPQAARLTGVTQDRIRRWLTGYKSAQRKKHYSALWKSQFPLTQSRTVLGFLDLIEIKFVGGFLDAGVSWPMIHKVRERAAELYPSVSHPFCTKQFVTDGHSIFIQVHRETQEESLVEIATNQQVFAEITRPFLKQLEFKDMLLERWWPMGREKNIVLDPKRNFGQPTIFREGIATSVLETSVRANGSIEEVARWYEISTEAVTEATEYERSLAA